MEWLVIGVSVREVERRSFSNYRKAREFLDTLRKGSMCLQDGTLPCSYYALSSKGKRQAGAAFRGYTGVEPEALRVVALGGGKYLHFFYVDANTHRVVGPPEFRKADSYFTQLASLPFKPQLPKAQILQARDELHELRKALVEDAERALAKHFELV